MNKSVRFRGNLQEYRNVLFLDQSFLEDLALDLIGPLGLSFLREKFAQYIYRLKNQEVTIKSMEENWENEIKN